MEQLQIFPEAGISSGFPNELLDYQPGLFQTDESNQFLEEFINTAPWNQKLVRMYDRELLTPRLTAWYGDPDAFDYAALGKSHRIPWTSTLLYIKSKVEALSGVFFNSVLLNYYRDGNDSVAWHSDKEAILGRRPVIASVSFGQVRSFDIRRKEKHGEHYSIKLESGSYMLMKGDLQEHWEHRVAKSVKRMRPRVNLTFRLVK